MLLGWGADQRSGKYEALMMEVVLVLVVVVIVAFVVVALTVSRPVILE